MGSLDIIVNLDFKIDFNYISIEVIFMIVTHMKNKYISISSTTLALHQIKKGKMELNNGNRNFQIWQQFIDFYLYVYNN